MVISKLLWCVFHKFGDVPHDSLKPVLISFYLPSEVPAAKEAIYKTAEDCQLMVVLNLSVDAVQMTE